MRALLILLILAASDARADSPVCGTGTDYAVIQCLRLYADAYLDVDRWTVRFALPYNRPAGEPVSFRLFFGDNPRASPSSADLNAVRKNHVLIWEGQERPLSDEVVRFIVPPLYRNVEPKICIRNISTGAQVSCTESSEKGGLVKVPLSNQRAAPLAAPADRPFGMPDMHEASTPIIITGPMNGDLSDTELTVGGRPARVLSESKLGLLAELPSQDTGPLEVSVKEAGRSGAKVTRFYTAGYSDAGETGSGSVKRMVLHLAGLDGVIEPLRLTLHDGVQVRFARSASRFRKNRDGQSWVLVINPSQIVSGSLDLAIEAKVYKQAGLFLMNELGRPPAIHTELTRMDRPEISEVVTSSLRAWILSNDVEVEGPAQKEIVASFADARSLAQLEETWQGSQNLFESFSSFATLLVRMYCYELRDRAIAPGRPRPPARLERRFYDQSALPPSRPTITKETVDRLTLSSYLRQVWARIRLEDAIALVRTAPERLRVSVNGSLGDGVHNLTNRFIILQQGPQTIDIRSEDGRRCTCTRIIVSRGAGDPFLCDLNGSAPFKTSADCQVQ